MSAAEKHHDKYIVWKSEDITEVLQDYPHLQKTFVVLCNAINDHRSFAGKGKNKYIVCNQDEPYAEKVWQEILDGEKAKLEEK